MPFEYTLNLSHYSTAGGLVPMRIADLGAGAGVIGISLALRGGVGDGEDGGEDELT